jgi:phasin family protein
MLQCSKTEAPEQLQPSARAATPKFTYFIKDHTMISTEHFTAAQKANAETLLSLTRTAFEGVEKLVELNLQVAKTTLSEAADGSVAMLSIKDPQELLALQARLLAPSAEKAAAYSRHVYAIASGTNAAVSKVVEDNFAEVQKLFVASVDAAMKGAPAGSENAVALVKSAVAATNQAIESAQKAAKQAAGVAEANFHAVTDTATKSVQAAFKA